jgi:hypothetical protein
MTNYAIAKPYWKTAPAKHNPSLLDKSLFKFNQPPHAKVDSKTLINWEGTQRESIGIASHSHWFVKASVAGLSDLQDHLHSDPPDSFEKLQDVWNKVEDMKELLQSAGKGIEDLAKLTVGTCNDLLLVRRDSWLENFNKSLSTDLLQKLRSSDLQQAQLFDEALVQESLVQAEKKQSDQRQNRLISGIWDLSKGPSTQKSTFSKDNPTGFNRKPFNPNYNASSGFNSQPSRDSGRSPRVGNFNNNNNNNYNKNKLISMLIIHHPQ